MKELKSFRNSLGMTCDEFAGKIGVSVSLYSKIETGNRKPSRSFIEKLKRERIAHLTLEGLPSGTYRPLTIKEVHQIYALKK